MPKKDLAKEKEGGEKTEETESASSSPEDIYKQNCISCHGDAYQGGVGPALKGVADRLSEDEVKEVIANGRGAMPSGLVDESNPRCHGKVYSRIKIKQGS